MEDTQMEMIDYLIAIWKRKWAIIIGTILCMIIVGGISFFLKPVFEIDAIIQPGKFFVEMRDGNFEEVIVESPQQIANKVRHESYDSLIMADLKMDKSRMPKINGEILRDTLLTRVWIRNHDVALSKKILNSLINLIKEDIDSKIDIERSNVDKLIKDSEIEIGRNQVEIEILQKKLKIIDQRKKDIITEMKLIKTRIDELEKEQLKVLKKESRSEIESLGLLLYSTEILQSLRSYDLLNEKLSNEGLEEENVNSLIQEKKSEINKTENVITNLKERKGLIDKTKIIKHPTSTLHPVSPKKTLHVVITGIMSCMLFILVVLFSVYIQKQKL